MVAAAAAVAVVAGRERATTEIAGGTSVLEASGRRDALLHQPNSQGVAFQLATSARCACCQLTEFASALPIPVGSALSPTPLPTVPSRPHPHLRHLPPPLLASAAMIFRIRLPSGTTDRVTLAPPDRLPQLGEKINALNKLQGTFALYSDPAFTVPFVFESAKHGDIIFIKGTMLEQPSSNAQSSSAPNSNSASNPASDSAPAQKPESRSSAPDGSAAPTPANTDKQPADPKDPPPIRCFCGPRRMCERCMPKEDKRARAESELRKFGKRGSSIAVLEALEALKFRITPAAAAHASAAAIDSDAANTFQAYLAETSFSQQRIGFCYGHVDDDDTTNVLAIYEPPQRGGHDAYALVEGDEAGDMTQRADSIAKMLGLRLVGVVISACPRKCILSAMDVVIISRLVAALPEEERKAFVAFVVSTADTGQTLFEAYQISDLVVEMYEAEAFEDVSKQKPNGGRVLCSQDVLVEGKDTRKVPVEFFLLNVPIKSYDSWLRTKFAIENRDIAPQGPADLRKAMDDESVPYHKRLADFHLLLFLSNVFDVKSDMPGLCSAAKDGGDIGEGYRLMIDNMAST